MVNSYPCALTEHVFNPGLNQIPNPDEELIQLLSRLEGAEDGGCSWMGHSKMN